MVSQVSLVAVDLDGTLLTNEGKLAPEGGRLLRQVAEMGIYVVLATARVPASVQGFYRLLGIDGPMICVNGAQVWASPAGPAWVCHTIPKEAALAIARLADEQGWELSITIGSITYWRQRSGQRFEPVSPNMETVATNSEVVTDDVVRIFTWQREAFEGIRLLCRKLAGQCYAETYLNPDGSEQSLGVFPWQASKGQALALVRENLGLSREQVVAIGDHLNDLPMFQEAGIGVAMGNAVDEVKRKATLVASTDDEEGVAWALRTIVKL